MTRPLIAGTPRFPVGTPGLDDAARWAAVIERHGIEDAALHVQGDFAVALPLADGSVFLAVDRFAVRTLCFRVTAAGLEAAERADAFDDAEIDPQALFDYLYFHVIPSPRTVFAGVQRLPPGHSARFDGTRLNRRRYWTPAFRPQARPDFGTLREEFRALLAQAVRRSLGDGRAACYLSGGTDSSTVAGMIGEVTGTPPVAFSIGFADEAYDEMQYARIAARRFGCEHREHYVTPDDLVHHIPRVAAAYDQPFGNSSVLPAFLCAERARAEGVDRLLAGDGGDELFGGNTRYATQRVFGWYQRVPGWLRHGLVEPAASLGVVRSLPVLRRAPGYIRQANTPLPDRAQAFNLIRRLGYEQVLSPALLEQVDTADVDAQQRTVWAEPDAADELNRYLAYDWKYTLAECDLPKVCGSAALAGISVGFPMLDADLVDFSTRLPISYKLRGPQLRWFFKEALRGLLPDEIITKPKQGFGLPFGVWLVRHAPLRKLAEDSVQSAVERGLLAPDGMRALWASQLPSHPHYYGTLVWVVMMMEQWFQFHRPRYKL